MNIFLLVFYWNCFSWVLVGLWVKVVRFFDLIVEDIFYGCCKWFYFGYILLSNEDVFVIFYIIKMMYYMYISVYKNIFLFLKK